MCCSFKIYLNVPQSKEISGTVKIHTKIFFISVKFSRIHKITTYCWQWNFGDL